MCQAGSQNVEESATDQSSDDGESTLGTCSNWAGFFRQSYQWDDTWVFEYDPERKWPNGIPGYVREKAEIASKSRVIKMLVVLSTRRSKSSSKVDIEAIQTAAKTPLNEVSVEVFWSTYPAWRKYVGAQGKYFEHLWLYLQCILFYDNTCVALSTYLI